MVGRGGSQWHRAHSLFVHWILNAERALASMEKTGEALNRMAEGNVGWWIFISYENPPFSLFSPMSTNIQQPTLNIQFPK
jgi:hypothetical protein